MRYSLLTQVTLIGLSLVIFLTVIKPMFASISLIQDERMIYADAVSKAKQFNQKLEELIAVRDSFRAEDVQKLATFLPATIDVVQVMRDIETIFELADSEPTSITLGEVSGSDEAEVYIDEYGQEQVTKNTSLAYQDVTVTFDGSYEDMKEILAIAERNKTMLEVTKLTFGAIETDNAENSIQSSLGEATSGDMFTFEITFRVYGLAKAGTIEVEY